jgi:hypothetical protein
VKKQIFWNMDEDIVEKKLKYDRDSLIKPIKKSGSHYNLSKGDNSENFPGKFFLMFR